MSAPPEAYGNSCWRTVPPGVPGPPHDHDTTTSSDGPNEATWGRPGVASKNPLSPSQLPASGPERTMGEARTAAEPVPEPPEDLPEPTGPPEPEPPGPPALVIDTLLASPLAWAGTASAKTAAPAARTTAHLLIMLASSVRFHVSYTAGERTVPSPRDRTRGLVPGRSRTVAT